MQLLRKLFTNKDTIAFAGQVYQVLGIRPGNIALYRAALSHRSVKEHAAENNERLEYLGDAILRAIVAD